MKKCGLGFSFGLALLLGCATNAGDTEIERLVEEDLSAELNLRGYLIGVASENGEVEMEGRVGSAADRVRAGEIAQQVEGVSNVRNWLTVLPLPAVSPALASPPPSEPSDPSAR